MLRLYDTATREVRELELREPGKVGIYVCGPTVYGPAHLGHGRATLTYDILRRYLEWSGLDVRLVSNVTDIEDKIIERAVSESRSWNDVTIEYETMWWKAMDGIGNLRPDDVPHATDYVDEMIELIGTLIDRDAAYVTEAGVYMSVEAVPDYGALAHQSIDDMRTGGGDREVIGSSGKRHPADFVLWKFKHDDPTESDPSWAAPWGWGRPGWHTECVVMSLDLLGEGFDLHCGGQDLRFPHHENERAQAVAVGKEFARHWMHNGFLVDVEGEKMSKSIGNVANLLDLIEQYDQRAYRLVLLQSHYRSPIKLSRANIEQAVTSLGGLDAFAARAVAVVDTDPDDATLRAFCAAMEDDLNTPKAMSIVFDTVRAANAAIDAGERLAGGLAAAVLEMTGAVGLTIIASGTEVPAEVTAKVSVLDAARTVKDYSTADSIRAELQADGWIVEITKDGTTVRR